MPRGQAQGVAYQRPENERYNYDEPYLRVRMVGELGGWAAEEMVYGTRSSGAENDRQQATALARQMATRWGMSELVGPVALAPRDNGFMSAAEPFGFASGAKQHSEATAQVIDVEVRRILQECYEQAARLRHRHRAELEALARALLEQETLDQQQVLQVTGLPRAPRLAGQPMLPTNGAADEFKTR